jgi:hypothetical protein
MSIKKKLFPQIKKKLNSFLTDESWKITRKNALGLAVWAMLVSWIDDTMAVITTSSSPALPFPAVTDWVWDQNTPFHDTAGPIQMTKITAATCSHASWIVNGHYSANPTVNLTNTVYNLTSHGSHGSHGSHCNGSRW